MCRYIYIYGLLAIPQYGKRTHVLDVSQEHIVTAQFPAEFTHMFPTSMPHWNVTIHFGRRYPLVNVYRKLWKNHRF